MSWERGGIVQEHRSAVDVLDRRVANLMARVDADERAWADKAHERLDLAGVAAPYRPWTTLVADAVVAGPLAAALAPAGIAVVAAASGLALVEQMFELFAAPGAPLAKGVGRHGDRRPPAGSRMSS